MHKHAIDWLRQLSLTADAALAEKRWNAAATVAKTRSRARLIELLRLFLFPTAEGDVLKRWTDELIGIDPEFPVSQNLQEVRLLAGFAIVATFEEVSTASDTLALGMRAARFPEGRVKPIQPAILTEAEEYARSRSRKLRPDEFATDDAADLTNPLTRRAKAIEDAETGGDATKIATAEAGYRDAVARTFLSSHRAMAKRVEQLAEESALLWWVLGEYSDTLQEPLHNLPPAAYAFPAAAEAAARSVYLAPPPSIGALLARALRSCKPETKKLTLIDYVTTVNSAWRASQARSLIIADCRDLVPVSAVLEKTEELGNASTAVRTVAKICPGLKADLPLTPAQAASQFYNEILFVRALAAAG
jgi:hypothetical protein